MGNTEQTHQLVAHLSDITYLHTHQNVVYIQKTWKITDSMSGLNKWLHQNGFSYNQPNKPFESMYKTNWLSLVVMKKMLNR
jgi:transposase